MHEERCRTRRRLIRVWGAICNNDQQVEAETAPTRNLLRCHFVLRDPRITVARNSTTKFHVKKPVSKNSEFVARCIHKSVLSVHNTLTVEFQRTGLLHFPATGYSLYYAARTERKERTGLCQLTLTSPLCYASLLYFRSTQKSVVFIYKPNKFCCEVWHSTVTGECETKGGPEISGLAYLAISENNNMATRQDYINTDYSMDSAKQRKQKWYLPPDACHEEIDIISLFYCLRTVSPLRRRVPAFCNTTDYGTSLIIIRVFVTTNTSTSLIPKIRRILPCGNRTENRSVRTRVIHCTKIPRRYRVSKKLLHVQVVDVL